MFLSWGKFNNRSISDVIALGKKSSSRLGFVSKDLDLSPADCGNPSPWLFFFFFSLSEGISRARLRTISSTVNCRCHHHCHCRFRPQEISLARLVIPSLNGLWVSLIILHTIFITLKRPPTKYREFKTLICGLSLRCRPVTHGSDFRVKFFE